MFEKIKQSFENHPWLNSTLIILVIVIGVMAYFLFKGKTTKVVFFPGTAANYYVPDAQSDKQADTSALPKNATDLKDVTLIENLHNYGTHSQNISSGIRKSTTTSYKSWLLSVAGAVSTRSYPVIYYCDLTQDPKIVEINGLTGEKKTILSEKYPITSLDFSEVNQALVYAVASSSDQNSQKASVKIYYLNNSKTTTIWDNINGRGSYPIWSPNGEYIKGNTQISDDLMDVSIYNVKKNLTNIFRLLPGFGLSYYDAEKDINSTIAPINSPLAFKQIISCTYGWGDDSQTAVSYYDNNSFRQDSAGKNLDLNGNPTWQDNNFATCDLFSGKVNVIDDGHKSTSITDSRRLNSAYLVSKKIFGLGHVPYETDTSTGSNYGWLYMYDQETKKLKSFEKEMGINNNDKFLISKDGEKVVYENRADKKMKVLNIDTGEVKAIDKTFNTYLSPEGWNGNEDNVISIANNIFYNINLSTGNVTKITQ